ncbi:hypothetical protein [Aureicoccus marinus]|uniref:DUF4390 domain-containing protein n=1 Tax=Aureicoccus marinus TaxID=754435 RepID=A0A2S7T5H2_9FLAO|nr:hypothetical protein [Aureicoccus marinus]PQJ14735.1 hypothetical protein BST99_02330 [Aureicoccus marinus]
MKKYLLLLLGIAALQINAQTVEGKLTLNGKSKTTLELESNSAVELFKAFKEKKYQLRFVYEADNVEGLYAKNKEKMVIFFNVVTTVKRDGKLVKNVIRKQPIPYFPGDMFLPAEAFDFVSVLSMVSQNEKDTNSFLPAFNEQLDGMEGEKEMQILKEGMPGYMQPGSYTIELSMQPVGYKGRINPVVFNFILRKRPGRAKY